MANKIITLASGAVLEIQMASFEKAHKLLKVVTKEIEGVKLAFGLNGSIKDMFTMDVNDATLNTFKDVFARLLSSDAVEEALWACLATVTYDKKRVTKDLFNDDEAARCDFLVMQKEVMVYNLTPFFKNLGLLLSGIGQKSTAALKSE
jgi:hypothetical protein